MFDLVVKTPFGPYAVGERISDRETVKAVIAEGRSNLVLKVAHVAEDKPAKPVKAD